MQALHATQQFTPLWETLKEEFNAVTFATGQVCGLFSYALTSTFSTPVIAFLIPLRWPFHSHIIAFLIPL